MLFPALPPVESLQAAPGRIKVDGQLKTGTVAPLGSLTAGQTEILTGDLQPGAEVVTGIVLPAASRSASATNGNPLLGNQNRGGGPGGPGGPGRGGPGGGGGGR